jgi:hypothetical protein
MVMWRGLSRLTDVELGASLGMRLVGNRKYSVPVTSSLIHAKAPQRCINLSSHRMSQLMIRAKTVQLATC